MDDQFRTGDVFQQLIDDLGELRLVTEKFRGEAVHLQRALITVAPRIEVTVKMFAGQATVDHLDAGHLDDAMTEPRLKTRGFRIQNNLPHRH